MQANGEVMTAEAIIRTVFTYTYGRCDFCGNEALLMNGACEPCRRDIEALNDK